MKPHRNIYELIDTFKREQAYTEVIIQQLETGAQPPPRKRRYVEIDKRLRLKEIMEAK